MNSFLKIATKAAAISLSLMLVMTACQQNVQYSFTVKIENTVDSECVNGVLVDNTSSEVAMPGETKTFTFQLGHARGVPTFPLSVGAECRTKDGKGVSKRVFIVSANPIERTIIVKPSTTAPDYQITAPGPTIELVK
jgi:hypothetical protein